MECRFKLRSLVPEIHTSCDGCCRLQINIDHLGDWYVHPKHGTQAFLHSTTTGMWALHVGNPRPLAQQQNVITTKHHGGRHPDSSSLPGKLLPTYRCTYNLAFVALTSTAHHRKETWKLARFQRHGVTGLSQAITFSHINESSSKFAHTLMWWTPLALVTGDHSWKADSVCKILIYSSLSGLSGIHTTE